MELIIGGKAQGKLAYALNHFQYKKEDIADGCINQRKPVIYNLQDAIYQIMKQDENPEEMIEEYISVQKDAVIICDEVGCGIVPMDEFERAYRERVGRILCTLAAKSKRVHRVYCGIGELIKDA